MYEVIIIGGGTAGMTAAIYAARAGKDVVLFEKQNCGGQIITSPKVENYPGIPEISGFELADTMKKQAEQFGAKIITENVISAEIKGNIKIIKTSKKIYEAKAIIYAGGVEKRKLGIEREAELIGSGVSYCAYCDGNFFRNRTVAVIGGGNSALDDTLYLSEICKKIYLVHRRHEFRGDAAVFEMLKTLPNVEIITGYTPEKLAGDFALSAVELKSTEGKESKIIEVNGMFVAIGNIPVAGNFGDVFEVDENGYIITDENCKTGKPGIYAAGDCRQKNLRQLITAASDGAIAAARAVDYINNIK